jgi:multidrug efflux system membrane fusion protein
LVSSTPHSPHPIDPSHQLPPPGSHRFLKIVVAIIVLIGFGAIFLLVWRDHGEAAAAPAGRGAGGPITVMIAKARTGDIGVYLQAIGTVTPVYTSSITGQASGQVTAVHFTEGQMVQKGEPLIDIDDRPYQATLLQAQGALERDENLLAQAKMDLERYQTAWSRNAIPKQTLDDQEKLVLQDQGTVKNDQGTLQYDQTQLDYCHINAPIAGRVGLRLIDPGNVVLANSTVTLAVVTQMSPITVVFTIPEDSIPQVLSHSADGAKLQVDAYDRMGQKKLVSGHLLTLDNQIDTTTGTVKARALFPNKDGVLFPNQFVNVRLLVTTLKNVTLIPASAIQHNEQVAFVYVIQKDGTDETQNTGTAHMQNVTPGVTDNGITEVKDLAGDATVANSGFERLFDKAKVSIATRPTSGPSIRESDAP